jgi:polyvinyl alcohol dehydrogenase (cytochrome)
MPALRHRVRAIAAVASLAGFVHAAAEDSAPAGQSFGPEKNLCANAPGPVAVGTAQWNGWGRDLDNSRYQPEPAIRAADVAKLAVKWAYGYHGNVVYGQPTVVDGRLFVTSSSGRVYALDARTGCTYWTYDAAASTGTAISVGEFAEVRAVYQSKRARRRDRNAHIDMTKPPSAVFFGDDAGFVYALDAEKGTLLWKTQADAHPLARITGAPVLYRNRLYVPVSSIEDRMTPNAGSACCTFRGSVVAMDMPSGQIAWKHFMIAGEARPYRKTGDSADEFGPAGAAVWSAPTIDAKRALLYAATGNSFTSIEAPGSEAIVALDLEDGSSRWVKQLAPHDSPATGTDFGSSPILRTLPSGRQVILAGQKSGMVYALDPDQAGDVVWQAKVSEGSGGIQWGSAADHRNLYVAGAGLPPGGVTAIDLKTGSIRWRTPAPAPVCSWGARNCVQAQPQAVTVMPGIAFAGALDGHLRAYSTINGNIVWDFDTAREFPTVNDVKASGGSLDQGGPTIVNGMVFVNSGYGRSAGQPGNVLLAFSVGGK